MMNVDGPRYIYTLEEMYAIEKVVNSTRISTEVLIHNFKQGKPSRANNSEGGPYGEDHALKDRGSQRSHSRHGARHVGRNGDVNVRRTRAHRDHETFELGMQYEEECQKKEQLAARKEAQASLTNTRQGMHPGPTDGLSLKQDIQSRIAGMSIPCVATKNDSTNCNQGAKSESATAKVNVTPTPANEVDAMFMGNFDDILSDNNLWSGLLSDSSNSKINVTTGGTGSLLSVVRVTEPHRSEDRGGEKNIPTAISHTDSKNQNRAPNNTNIVEVLTSALQKGAEDTSTYLPKGHSLASDRKAGNNVVVEGVPFTSRSATAVEWNTNTTAVSGEGRRKHSSRPMGDTSTMYTNNQQVGSLSSTSHNRSQPNRNGSAQSGGAGRNHRGNRNAQKYTEAPAGTGTKPNHNSSNQCVGVTKETRGNNASALDTDSRSQKNSNHGSNYGSASTGIDRSGRADSVFTQLDNHITITSNTHSHGQAITLSSQGKGFNVSSLQSLLKKN